MTDGGGYIDCRSTVSAARKAGLSICDYVERLWEQEGATEKIIEQMRQCGSLDKARNICEIGPGTGRYLHKIIDRLDPAQYVFYETAADWADWLGTEYPVERREADGATLHFEPDGSCDLVHAHGVFVYLKFLHSFKYFKEMIRACRPGGYIVFDFYSTQVFDTGMIARWLNAGVDYPTVLPPDTCRAFFKEHGADFIAEFTAKHGYGHSTYHVYRKQAPSIVEVQSDQTVSVVIPTYNRSALIGRAINSVLAQTRPVAEILVVDDGSTDGTRDVVAAIGHPGLRYIPLDGNRGAQRARNIGIRESSGEWIGFLDSDDEWVPERVEKALASSAWSGADISYCWYFKQEADGTRAVQRTPAHSGKVYADILAKPFTTFPGLFVRRHCLERIDGLDEQITSWQEWETSIRLARYFQFSFIPEPLFIWHWHTGPTISKNVIRDADGYVQVLEKHRAAIEAHCGDESLIAHYMQAAQKYVEGGAVEPAVRIKGILQELFSRTKGS